MQRRLIKILIGVSCLIGICSWQLVEPEATQAVTTTPLTMDLGTKSSSDNILETVTPTTILYSGSWGTCAWNIDSNGVLTIHEGQLNDVYAQGGTAKESVWIKYSDVITSVVLDGTVVMPDNSAYFFKGLTKAQTMDLTGLDTSRATNFVSMFEEDSALSEIKGLETWDVSRVTNLSYLFQRCSALTTVDVANWDTSNVIRMFGLFSSTSIRTLDLNRWDTSQLTEADEIFGNMQSLTNLNISNWNTQQLTSLNRFFKNDVALTSLDIANWDTRNVIQMTDTFLGLSNLQTLDIASWDTHNVVNMNGTFMNTKALTTIDVSRWRTDKVTNFKNMFSGCDSVTALDVSHFNTSNARNMNQMFDGCSSVTELDVSSWDTSNVTDMGGVFKNTRNISQIPIEGWVTTQVMIMDNVFSGTSHLTSLDLTNWRTDSATTLSGIFSGTVLLTSVDVADWQISNVKDLSSVFSNTPMLTNVDVSHWDTHNVTNMRSLFSKSGLTSATIENWDTSSLQTMTSTFEASNFTDLDLSKWDTSSVTEMSATFKNAKVVNLNVADWDVRQVSNMNNLFQDANELRILDLSGWNLMYTNFKSGMLDFKPGTSKLWQITLGPDTSLTSMYNGYASAILPVAPGNNTPILDDTTETTYHSISAQWQAVDQDAGGTVHAPKGALYTPQEIQDAYAPEATRTKQTFVWQQQPVLHLDMTVPTLDFGKVEMSGGLHRRVDPDWGISVTNTSEPVMAIDTRLSVALSQPFTNDQGVVVPDILRFRDAQNQDMVIGDQPQVIYADQLGATEQSTLTWDLDHGFLLYLPPERAVDTGRYKATLNWNLTVGP